MTLLLKEKDKKEILRQTKKYLTGEDERKELEYSFFFPNDYDFTIYFFFLVFCLFM